jgi:CubicO group peptidase (beta-lactamase class C family)
MFLRFRDLAIASLCVTPSLANFLGPRYPPPVDLSSNKSTIPTAWKNVTTTLEKLLNNGDANSTLGGVAGLKNLTFSMGLFSLYDSAASDLQFHYTGPEVAASNGTKKVDANSIYGAASITKVFTVLTGLLKLNDAEWEQPLSEIFPTIEEHVRKLYPDGDPILSIQWDKVTPRNLAAQIAGLPTNPYILDLAFSLLKTGVDPATLGLPTWDFLNLTTTDPLVNPECSGGFDNVTCFIPSIAVKAPNFLPWTSPVYSNNGFLMLASAIENITGKDIPTHFKESIFEPLKMDSSYTGIVPKSEWNRSVFVSDLEWSSPVGISAGSGGLRTTINDLTKFGIGLLNSTILSPVETRRWMKPVSHTGRFQFSFGAPWEILRYQHDSGVVSDIYTKSGDSGSYSSFFVLIPDYNVGFTVLTALSGAKRNPLAGAIGDLLSNTILPALEAQAAAEAEHNFAGTYSVPGHNSSLTLSVNKTEGAVPGLILESIINNGSDIREVQPTWFGPGARLLLSIPEVGGRVAFRIATPGDIPIIDKSRKLFSGFGSGDFVLSDSLAYGGISISLFEFEVDEDGKAKTASHAMLRTTFERKD